MLNRKQLDRRLLGPAAVSAVLAALALACTGCATSSQRSPAEAQTGSGVAPERCSWSTKAVRMDARRGRYAGADGFDARGCPP